MRNDIGRNGGASTTLLLPRTTPGAGELLWGEQPRRQPVAPLIAMAMLLLLVSAPAAMSSNGTSSNPVVLLQQIADSTYRLTGLMDQANRRLERIDGNLVPLTTMQRDIDGIVATTASMERRTGKLDSSLGRVAGTVRTTRARLDTVRGHHQQVATGAGAMGSSVTGALRGTRAISGDLVHIQQGVGGIDRDLGVAVGSLAQLKPQTTAFATNRTRRAIVGGDPTRYSTPNVQPGTPVIGVVLPMLSTLQRGGRLPARTEQSIATNPIVDLMLDRRVPDGTNVAAIVRPYDGVYGLPSPQWFVANRVHSL